MNLLQTEIAPPKMRGFIVGLAQQMIGIGFIVANWVGYGCQFINGDQGWRLALGLQLVPAFLLLVGIQFLPYSPVRIVVFPAIFFTYLSSALASGAKPR